MQIHHEFSSSISGGAVPLKYRIDAISSSSQLPALVSCDKKNSSTTSNTLNSPFPLLPSKHNSSPYSSSQNTCFRKFVHHNFIRSVLLRKSLCFTPSDHLSNFKHHSHTSTYFSPKSASYQHLQCLSSFFLTALLYCIQSSELSHLRYAFATSLPQGF